jgi:hypothetical protein
MKTTRNVLCALLLLGGTAGAARAATSVSAGVHIGSSGRTAVDLGFFYDDLAPYGNWIERPSHGWVWTPRQVSSSWRPYRDGHWVWTDEGWTWISDEPYGWATYHYGRWYDDSEIGWSWVPDDEWAPSWVSFQEGADYVGWAPLPPGVNVSVSVGNSYGGYAYGIAPEDYLFVPERHFLESRISAYYVSQDRIGPLYRQTRNYTNYRFNGGRAFNYGVPVERFQRYGKVRQYQVADLGANYRTRGARFQGDRVEIFRPRVQKAARIAPPFQRAAARRAVVSAAQFRAAHPDRVARRQERLARQQQFRDPERRQRAEIGGQGPAFRQQHQKAAAVQQRQARVDQRQLRVDKRQTRVDRQQLRGDRSQQRQARVDQRQFRGDKRQTRVDRQQVHVDRSQQRQARQAPNFRQHQKAAPQQRQARVDRRQVRVDRQQVRVDRQQMRVDRSQQRQARAERQQFRGDRQQRQPQMDRQQRQAARQGQAQRPPRNGGGQGGHRGHGRPGQ